MGGESREDNTLRDPTCGDEAGPPVARASLLVNHRDGLQVIPLDAANPVIVGRSPPADVVLRSMHLSRRHAVFTLRAGTVWVEDLGSTNGTQVNGRPIREPVPVGPEDEVVIGSASVTVHQVGAPRIEGVEGHQRFVQALERELERSTTFDRSFAVMVLKRAKAPGQTRAGLAHWAPQVRDHLRPVDRLGVYSADLLEVLLPESTLARATRLAEKLQAADPQLRIGLVAFPRDGASLDVLSEKVHVALASADEGRPIAVARGSRTSLSDGQGTRPLVRQGCMLQVYDVASRVAASTVPVLLLGETGTGKEVLARSLHEESGRTGPLRVLNCGAIPEQLVESALFGHERGSFTGADRRAVGIFEEASGGTVLLDEIGELSPAAQVALLRVLETRTITRIGSTEEIPVDVRVLAATHRDLEQMCAAGSFRLDLLYRLNAVTLRIPPLRDRVDEIAPLARRFLAVARLAPESAHVVGFDERAISVLERYPWPGNVRELRNAVERAAVVADGALITEEDLPERVRSHSEATPAEAAPREWHTQPAHSTDGAAPPAGLPADPRVHAGGRPRRDAGRAERAPSPREAWGDERRPKAGPTDREWSEVTEVRSASEPAAAGGASVDLKGRVAEEEVALIRSALASSRGNRTLAADLLGLPRRTLQYKMRAYRILDVDEAAPPLERRLDEEGRQLDFAGRVAAVERQLLDHALARANGDLGAAAALLRIQPRTLRARLRRLGRD